MQPFKVTESIAEDRTRIAREQSALFPAQIALARWSIGAKPAHLLEKGNLPLRAAYYAQAQRDFQAWLDRGGFTQYDEAPRDQPPPPAIDGQSQSADICLD